MSAKMHAIRKQIEHAAKQQEKWRQIGDKLREAYALLTTNAAVKGKSLGVQIVEYVYKQPGTVLFDDIAANVDGHAPSIRATLGRLVCKGMLERVAPNIFRAVDGAEAGDADVDGEIADEA